MEAIPTIVKAIAPARSALRATVPHWADRCMLLPQLSLPVVPQSLLVEPTRIDALRLRSFGICFNPAKNRSAFSR
jgi:hypothetical protein